MLKVARGCAAVGIAALMGLASLAPVTASAQTAAPAAPAATTPAAKMHHKMPSEHVKLVQEALDKQGYSLKADGIMGKATRAALLKFQGDHNLKKTGHPDAETLKLLNVA